MRQLSKRPGGADMNAEMATLADKLTAQDETPYIIVGGGSNPIGALGYVNCVRELVEQAEDIDVTFDYMVHATGSSGTQAGLVVGLAAIQSDISLLGHRRARASQARRRSSWSMI